MESSTTEDCLVEELLDPEVAAEVAGAVRRGLSSSAISSLSAMVVMVKVEPDCATARKESYSGLLSCDCLITTSGSISPFNIDTTLAMDGRLGPADCTHNNATLSTRWTCSSYPTMFIVGSTRCRRVPSSCNLQACDKIYIRKACLTISINELDHCLSKFTL